MESELIERLDRIEAKLTASTSPWCRGDREAAEYAAYRSTKAFRKWASEAGVRPSVDGGLNFWSKREIDKAREKGKR